MNTLGQSLYALLVNPNAIAFLHVIRAGETSHEDSAYSMLFGGDAFDGFADHPRKLIKKSGYNSTAAGAYQFLSRTWDECAKALDLPDFSPRSQDVAALFLIRRRGALDDVLAGRVREAIAKCAKEWASLPGSPYGQPTKTMAQALDVYQQFGGTLTSQTPSEKPMAPLIPAAVSAIASIAPQLIRIFGSGSEVSERNAKAAEVVVQAAKEATGAVNEQHLIEKIEAKDPAVIQAVQQVVRDVWFEISVDSGGVEKARQFNDSGTPFWKQPALYVTAALLPLVYLVVWATIFREGFATQDLKTLVVTAIVSGVLSGIMGFWLGTSFSSQRKDEMRAK